MRKLGNIIIIILLVGITFFITRKYFNRTQTVVVTETLTDTIYNDTVIYKILPRPKPDTIIQTDTIIHYNDTTNYFEKYTHLFEKFYSQTIYTDTLKSDSSAFISVYDIILKNSIQHRELTYIDRTPTIINKTVNKYINNEKKFFIGAEVGIRTAQPEIIYKDLNDIQYKIGYDFVGKESGLRFGVYIRPTSLF